MNLTKFLDPVKSVAAVVLAVGGVFGMVYGFNAFIDKKVAVVDQKFQGYTPLELYNSLDKRVELAELQALLREARKQKYWLLEQLRARPNDVALLQELDEINAEIARLQARIAELKNEN